MCFLDRGPAGIDAVVGSEYDAYLSTLHRLWRRAQHPYADRLGRPKRCDFDRTERASVMRKLIGQVATSIPGDRWHPDCYSPRSSQALLVAVLGNLAQNGQLGLLGTLGAVRVEFEYQFGRTHFDAVLCGPSGSIVATVEAKFTERGFGVCRYPKRRSTEEVPRCDGSWCAGERAPHGCPMAQRPRNRPSADRYWAIVHDDWGIGPPPTSTSIPCPLRVAYQAAHNLAETRRLRDQAQWLLLYDGRNPYFAGPGRWVDTLVTRGTRCWSANTWQHLFHCALKQHTCALRSIAAIHGFI